MALSGLCAWTLPCCMLGFKSARSHVFGFTLSIHVYIHNVCRVVVYFTMGLTVGERVMQWLFHAVSGFFYALFVLVSPRRKAEKLPPVTDPLLLIPAVQLAEKIRRRQVCTSAHTAHITSPNTTGEPNHFHHSAKLGRVLSDACQKCRSEVKLNNGKCSFHSGQKTNDLDISYSPLLNQIITKI